MLHSLFFLSALAGSPRMRLQASLLRTGTAILYKASQVATWRVLPDRCFNFDGCSIVASQGQHFCERHHSGYQTASQIL